MKYEIDNIVQEVEQRYILSRSELSPSLTVIMSCSPNPGEISYLKQIYRMSDKYGVTLRELRTCDPLHIAEDLRGYKTDGVIRISDFGENNEYIDNRIGCDRDLDGFCSANRSVWVENNSMLRAFPCTALACYLTLLDYFNGEISGKDISIINRSNVIGKPLALLLTSDRGKEGNATVDIIHTRTVDKEKRIKSRDAIITATGVSNSFVTIPITRSTMNSLVIDVGEGVDENGKRHGDVSDILVNSDIVNVARIGKLTTTILFAKLFGGFKCVTWH